MVRTNIQRLIKYSIATVTACAVVWVAALVYFHMFVLRDPKLLKNVYRPNPYALGNILNSYFYYLYAEDPNNHITEIDYQDIYNAKEPDLLAFYKTLQWQHKTMFPFISVMNESWNQYNIDGSPKKNYLLYWQYVRPHIQQHFNQYLERITVQQPIMHFRCSDIPFNKAAQYHIITRKSVAWIAEKIKNAGYDNATMLVCNEYLTWDYKNSCQKYADFYQQQFAQHGISVQQQCDDVYSDFARMYYAPLLISLNGSSYSFMAGVAKDPKHYISANMGIEIKGKYKLQTEADWILDARAPMLHSQVDSYYDADTVIGQL